MPQKSYDVGIIGCGPTGLTLGWLLALRGVRVAMVERSREAAKSPRATHIDDEVVRIFQALGIADELEPTLYLPPTYEFFDKDWNRFLEFPLSNELSDQGWRSDYMFHQPDFESRMRERLDKSDFADLFFGSSVEHIEQSESNVLVRASAIDGGDGLEFSARFVVGCDGARSTVRKAAKVTLEDLHGTQRWLITDSLLDEGVEDVAERLFSYCPPLPDRAVTYITTGARRRRVEFKIQPDDDGRALEETESVWSLLAPYIPRDRATLERADAYEFNAPLARSWRVGRLLLAGDAAHQMPPKAGQGLCAGFRDAINLAWKLARCIEVPEADALLDTYESERRPHAKHWIDVSNSLAKSIEQMTVGNTQRDEAAPTPVADGDGGPPPRPQLGPGLGSGFPHAGELSVQPLVSGTRMDDRIGNAWALIASADLLGAQSKEAASIWTVLGAIILTPKEAHYEDWLAAHGALAAVVRPDRYLLGTANSAVELEDMAKRLADVLHLSPAT